MCSCKFYSLAAEADVGLLYFSFNNLGSEKEWVGSGLFIPDLSQRQLNTKAPISVAKEKPLMAERETISQLYMSVQTELELCSYISQLLQTELELCSAAGSPPQWAGIAEPKTEALKKQHETSALLLLYSEVSQAVQRSIHRWAESGFLPNLEMVNREYLKSYKIMEIQPIGSRAFFFFNLRYI